MRHALIAVLMIPAAASAAEISIEAYGKNETRGTYASWDTAYPDPSFDDTPGRKGLPNAAWHGGYHWEGSQLCLEVRGLHAQYPPADRLSIGYTVKLKGATFEDGSTIQNVVVYQYSGAPAQADITQCVATVPSLAADATALAADANAAVNEVKADAQAAVNRDRDLVRNFITGVKSDVKSIRDQEVNQARQVRDLAKGITWNFETGDLRGWLSEGEAFAHQPTYGDNPTARQRGQPSQHQGDYWVGTFENRHSAKDPAGQVQGDGPTGTLTTRPFLLTRPTISFLIGGGCDLGTERLELLVGDKAVRQATGKCTETMERASWDVSEFVGQIVRLRAVDGSSGGWGHINFDDIAFSGSLAQAIGTSDISGHWAGPWKNTRGDSGNGFLDIRSADDGTYKGNWDGDSFSGAIRTGNVVAWTTRGIWSSCTGYDVNAIFALDGKSALVAYDCRTPQPYSGEYRLTRER